MLELVDDILIMARLDAENVRRAILEEQKIIRIGYRPIRELQRKLRKAGGQ